MEDFVTFEIAKKLKEKGFDKPCSWLYSSYKVLNWFDDNLIEQHPDFVLAPTISQVLKWLREEKKYHVEFVGNACGYLFIVSDIPSEGGTDRYCSDYSGPNDGGTWDKYEDCALAAIEYIIDNLI